MGFARATKKRAKLRLGLIGPSGSGKTYSALAIACALAEAEGGRVAVIDTEHGSASLYGSGKPFDFDVLELSDFNPLNYVAAIHEAELAKYAVVLIDSLSHAWVGKGGALEMKDNASRRQGENGYTAWRHVTPAHNALIDAMLQSPCHVLATMRSKVEYVLEQNERGKSVPKKIGTAPIQRDGMDYEFTVVGDLDQDHVLTITKTRCPAVADQCIQRPGKAFAQTLLAWLADGVAVAPGVDLPSMPPLAGDAVRITWDRLKKERPADAVETWQRAVCSALGVEDAKSRPSSGWTVAELEAVESQIWPREAA